MLQGLFCFNFMNEAFERSSRVSFLTCVFHVLFPGAAESLRHLGWEPVVKPGRGSCLPILNGQWQLQLLEWSSRSGAWPAGLLESIATLMEICWKRSEPSLKVAKYSNHRAGKMWAGLGGGGRGRSQGVGF